MMTKFPASRALMYAFCLAGLGSAFPASAAEADAREVFAVAASGALTFESTRATEDISSVFLHYTTDGRAALIAELERTGVLAEALSKRAALRAELRSSSVQVRRRAGPDGLDEYDVSSEMSLQWSRCVAASGGCISSGPPKKVNASGTVIQVTLNGRPAYRVSTVRFEGAR